MKETFNIHTGGKVSIQTSTVNLHFITEAHAPPHTTSLRESRDEENDRKRGGGKTKRKERKRERKRERERYDVN